MVTRIEDQGFQYGWVGWHGNGDFHHEAIASRRRDVKGFFFFNLVAVGKHQHVREIMFFIEGRE